MPCGVFPHELLLHQEDNCCAVWTTQRKHRQPITSDIALISVLVLFAGAQKGC